MSSTDELLAQCQDLIDRCEDGDEAIREMLVDLRHWIEDAREVDVSSN